MYRPGAFLISTAALTSIFSFFFGGYYRERERAYRFYRNDKLHRTPVHQSRHGQNQKVPIYQNQAQGYRPGETLQGLDGPWVLQTQNPGLLAK
jgi:hypothetical protein